jgi:hypothetical protein
MKDKFTNNTNQEDADIANKLNAVAEETNVDPHYMNDLEQKLKSAHKPKTIRRTPSTN